MPRREIGEGGFRANGRGGGAPALLSASAACAVGLQCPRACDFSYQVSCRRQASTSPLAVRGGGQRTARDGAAAADSGAGPLLAVHTLERALRLSH